MKNLITKWKNNRTLKIIWKIVSIFLTLLIFGMLSVVLVQRFSNNRFNLGGYGIYTVATGSMVPEYKVKDLILTKKIDAKEIQVGDDVIYLGNKESVSGKMVTHRVISKSFHDGKYYFYTKGIANSLTDPEIDETQILGVVKTKLHLLSFCSHIINNSYGFMVVIFVPFAIFAFVEGKSIVDELAAEKKKG